MTVPATSRPGPDPRTTGQLAGALGEQVSRLVRDEIALATADVKTKAGKLAVGGGMLAGAAAIAFAGLISLLVAAGLGLAVYFSDWLSALIEGGIFVLIALILAWLGLKNVKRGTPPVPKEAIAGVKTDLGIVKGVKP